MKRFLYVAACLVLCLVMLCACGDDTPKGYELASDPERDGYYLYVPDGWSFSHADGVTTAYLSSLNTANVTAAYVDTDAASVADYWVTCKARLSEDFADFDPVKDVGDHTNVGEGSYIAYEVEYTGSHAGLKYRFHQYFVLCGTLPRDGLLVITYTGADEKNEISGLTDFSATWDSVKGMMQHLRFGTGVQAPTEDLGLADEAAPEGFKRANRFEYLGMDVYVPEAWRVTLSDGYIGVQIEEGATLGVTNLNLSAGVGGTRTSLDERMEHYGLTYDNGQYFTLVDYWNLLKKEYADYYADGTFQVMSEPALKGEEGTSPAEQLGESTYYAFSFVGVKYGVNYRVTLFVYRETGTQDTFRTMTYTTYGENAGALHTRYLDTVKRVLEEITY